MANKQLDTSQNDHLSELSESLEDFTDLADTNKNYGLLVLGVRMVKNPENHVETYLNVSGTQAVLTEGLYAELSSHIEEGDLSLFEVLKQVVTDLSREYDLDDPATKEFLAGPRVVH